LDRAHLLSKGESIQGKGVDLFCDYILNHLDLSPKIIDGACELIAEDRAQNMVESSLFRDAIDMFHDTSTYTKRFEPYMLKLSQNFIVEWASQGKEMKPLPQYVTDSVKLIDREKTRCELFSLDASTRRGLIELLDTYLVEQAQDKLTDADAVADLLDQNAVDDLKALYNFLERKRLGSKLKSAFEKWIDLTGTDIIFDEKEQDQMVIKLLCLKRQLDNIWRVSFHRNEDLGHGLRESFETFINKTKKTSATWNTDNSKPGEMIAKYVDLLLRGGAKNIPAALSMTTLKAQVADEEDNEEVIFDEDTEVNNQLDQVLDLFRFVHGKAVFEAFYKKDLARRLLMGRSASADAERSMLTRLKTGKTLFYYPQSASKISHTCPSLY
jgi:cullin 4